MTAVGFAMIVCGYVGMFLWGSHSLRLNWADYFFGCSFLVGVLILLMGLIAWLWQAMP
jgi:hypothetical protein